MSLTGSTIKELRALGLSDEIFDKVIEIIERSKIKAPKKGDTADRAARGTRLPADWVLTQKLGRYALGQGLTESEVRREAAKFSNYWWGKPGKNALKLDWEKTWITWILKVAQELGRSPVGEAASMAKPQIDPKGFSLDTWRSILRRHESTGQWKPDHGPAPEHSGCLVPLELLAPRQTSFDTSPEPCHK